MNEFSVFLVLFTVLIHIINQPLALIRSPRNTTTASSTMASLSPRFHCLPHCWNHPSMMLLLTETVCFHLARRERKKKGASI